ncbi:MAG: hypothetical protein GX456_17575 [Verrucomicrobia bacterium]|nr:hypothetical protein [Verrucomicrobiota bacterium]
MNNKAVFRGEVRVVAAFLIAFACEAITHGSSFLLKVDTSNPSAVTITATREYPTAEDSGTTTYDGVTLLEFFTSEEPLGNFYNLSPSTLQPALSGVTYTLWTVDNYSGTAVDLNLHENDSGEPQKQIFTLSNPAFTGTAALDLSGYSLPSPGKTGNILAGFSANAGAIIGEYQVVPEPHALPLAAGLALMVFVLVRRRLGQ